jgi:hypothetical protein
MEAGHNRLKLEELDARELPGSGTFRVFETPTPPGIAEPIPVAYSQPVYHGYRVFATNPLQVEGSATASFTETSSTATSSATYKLNGTIQLFGFGKLDLSGVIHSLGENYSHATGQLSLATRTGTISLSLSDPVKSAVGAIPSDMIFTVTSATGAYTHAGGAGIITFDVTHTGHNTGTISMSLT